MKRTYLLAAALYAAFAPAAQAQDLFLARLTDDRTNPVVENVTRLTSRPGYDSQPSWVDNSVILYTSFDADGLADIWRFDTAKKTSAAVTATKPEAEYSARVMPDGRISVVMVEKDSTQRIWSLAPNGGDPRVVVEHVKGVGYYTWLDANRVVAYVIGDPNMLELVDVRTGARQSIAGDIGRTIQRVPGRNAISFVQLAGDEAWICVYDVDTRAIELLVKTPQQSEFYTWTPAGALLASEGSQLLKWDGVTRGGWKPIADFASAGVHDITRLAVSPDGKQIVIVAAD
jgi:WD40 repeat protein